MRERERGIINTIQKGICLEEQNVSYYGPSQVLMTVNGLVSPTAINKFTWNVKKLSTQHTEYIINDIIKNMNYLIFIAT